MRREAHLVEESLKQNVWRDTYLYALLKDEWPSVSITRFSLAIFGGLNERNITRSLSRNA